MRAAAAAANDGSILVLWASSPNIRLSAVKIVANFSPFEWALNRLPEHVLEGHLRTMRDCNFLFFHGFT